MSVFSECLVLLRLPKLHCVSNAYFLLFFHIRFGQFVRSTLETFLRTILQVFQLASLVLCLQ